MRGLKNLGVAAVGTILLTVAASNSADARYKRDWRLGYQSGTSDSLITQKLPQLSCGGVVTSGAENIRSHI